MDDRLYALRQDVPPEMSERLRRRLRAQPSAPASAPARRPLGRYGVLAAVAATIALLVTVPQVRTSAQSFLALFRMTSFVALPVDADRIAARLETLDRQLDLESLIGQNVQVLEDPGPATPAVSLEQAAAMAGIDLALPGYLPATNSSITGIRVTGQRGVRVIADVERLRQIMEALGITDLEPPAGLHGQAVTVRVPPIVTVDYDGPPTAMTASFVQARAPEVELPSGVDLADLAEIGLRLLGLPPGEARQFAGAFDWHSTMLVPIPMGATSFKQVDINGARGIQVTRPLAEPLVYTSPSGAQVTSSHKTVVLWAARGYVYGVEGTFSESGMLRMAKSVR